MSFLAPGAFALSLLAIPLLALYMLRTRRHRQEVSSTMLWEKAGVAVTSAVPWQKLKITALLIAQLIALALFVLLLARPFDREISLLGPHTVFVIDTSGSMAMADRLDDAKRTALDLLDDVSTANVVSIVDAGPQPKVLAALARDPAELREIVEGITGGGGFENLAGGLTLARSLATPDRPTRILIFSDGGVAELAALEEPVVGADHLFFGNTQDNVAITALSGEASEDGRIRVFFEISNFGDLPQETVVHVAAGSQPIKKVPLTIPAGGRARDGLRVDGDPGIEISATLHDEAGDPFQDGLILDNEAFIVMGTTQRSTVSIVGEGSVFLDALLESVSGFEPAAGEAPDVLVIDGESAAELTTAAWLIRPSEPPAGVTITGLLQNTAASYQRPGEPLLADVDLSELAIAEADIVDAPGWVELVKAGDVPLVLLGEVDGHPVVYFTFDLTQSNLPVQVGFPILGSRLLNVLGGTGTESLLTAPAGAPIVLTPPPGTEARVLLPSGAVTTPAAGSALFGDTNAPGVYRVTYHGDDETVRVGPVAVRHFVATESVGAARTIETQALAAATTESTAIVRERTALIVSGLLLLLLVEWWIGHGSPRPGWLRRRSRKVPT